MVFEMIYILGASGQLGQEFKKLKAFEKAHFLSSEQLDVSNRSKLRDFLENNKICTLIDAAAYTQVVKTESEQKLAKTRKSDTILLLSHYSHQKKIRLVHHDCSRFL